MTLTPLDIEKFNLRTGFRGFVREDVERFRYEALRSVEDYLARVSALQARVTELERDLQQYRANEDLLKSSVVLAQKTSDELITAARQRAELIVREAEAEGEAIRRRLADARNEREQFEYAFHGLLSGFLHRLEQGNPALKPGPPNEPMAIPSRTEVHVEGAPVQDGTLLAAPGTQPPIATPSLSEPEQLSNRSFTTPSFTAPAAPAPPVPPNERDHDISDFTAALSNAPVQPSPPRLNVIEHGQVYSVPEPASAEIPQAGTPDAEAPPTAPDTEPPVEAEAKPASTRPLPFEPLQFQAGPLDPPAGSEARGED